MSALRKFVIDIGQWLLLGLSVFAVEIVRDPPARGNNKTPQDPDSDLESDIEGESPHQHTNKETKQ